MSRTDFDRFIKRQRDEAQNVTKDRQKVLKEWLRQLDDLYDKITKFLAPYIDSNTVEISYEDMTLHENFSGFYDVKKMMIHAGQSLVVFEPVGTMLIGSKGRVDVHGPQSSSRLALVKKSITQAKQLIQISLAQPGAKSAEEEAAPQDDDWTWKIVGSGPDMRFLDLTEDNFFDLLLSVTDA